MTITVEALDARRQQHAVFQLATHKEWHAQPIGLMSSAEYAERFEWLKQTLGEPYSEFDDLEIHSLFRWSSSPSVNFETGRVTGMTLVFRVDQDLTLFLLKWS